MRSNTKERKVYASGKETRLGKARPQRAGKRGWKSSLGEGGTSWVLHQPSVPLSLGEVSQGGSGEQNQPSPRTGNERKSNNQDRLDVDRRKNRNPYDGLAVGEDWG